VPKYSEIYSVRFCRQCSYSSLQVFQSDKHWGNTYPVVHKPCTKTSTGWGLAIGGAKKWTTLTGIPLSKLPIQEDVASMWLCGETPSWYNTVFGLCSSSWDASRNSVISKQTIPLTLRYAIWYRTDTCKTTNGANIELHWVSRK